jgi:formamidopyrimidine-DNA glycosylase
VPELPEVETVRRGLDRWVTGRTISTVQVLHPRAVRRHVAGAGDFGDCLAGRTVTGVRRRGKYLWLPLDDGAAIVGHLGMSGQLLMQPDSAADETHLRIRFAFADGGPQLRFVDQRTFGGLAVSPGGAQLPVEIAHIALDPMDESFADDAFVAAVRRRNTGVKRALLDQTLVSGVGNIYADESLWRARLHWSRPTATLTRPQVRGLLGSFDALYVNVNGQSGYFDRSLAVYGRQGEPCPRCGAGVKREPFMNRSAYSCPRCQRPPRGSGVRPPGIRDGYDLPTSMVQKGVPSLA